MNEIINKLGIPLVDPMRVPVKTIIENLNDPTAKQKSLITKHVASVHLVSVLDQNTIHLREYKDSTYWYSAIYVMDVQLKKTSEMSDVMTLLHQAFPEATLFIVNGENKDYISAASKRINQNDSERSVIQYVATAPIKAEAIQYLDLGKLPGDNLKEYFDNIVKTIYKIRVFYLTSVYPETDVDYKSVMAKYDDLQHDINQLREEYKHATMQAEKLDIDDRLYEKENQVATLINTLKGNN